MAVLTGAAAGAGCGGMGRGGGWGRTGVLGCGDGAPANSIGVSDRGFFHSNTSVIEQEQLVKQLVGKPLSTIFKKCVTNAHSAISSVLYSTGRTSKPHRFLHPHTQSKEVYAQCIIVSRPCWQHIKPFLRHLPWLQNTCQTNTPLQLFRRLLVNHQNPLTVCKQAHAHSKSRGSLLYTLHTNTHNLKTRLVRTRDWEISGSSTRSTITRVGFIVDS